MALDPITVVSGILPSLDPFPVSKFVFEGFQKIFHHRDISYTCYFPSKTLVPIYETPATVPWATILHQPSEHSLPVSLFAFAHYLHPAE